MVIVINIWSYADKNKNIYINRQTSSVYSEQLQGIQLFIQPLHTTVVVVQEEFNFRLI